MAVPHLPPTTTAADIAAALDVDGCVVVDELADGVMDRVQDELAPFVETTAFGPDSFSGRRTRRTGGLVARSPAARQLVMHPLVLDAARTHLVESTHIQLH